MESPVSSCSVEGCVREVYRRGICNSHLARLKRHGDVMADIPIGVRGSHHGQKCEVRSCVRPAKVLSACQAHHSRKERTGDYREDRPIAKYRTIRTPRPDMPDGWQWRVCSRCDQTKPLSEFPPSASSPRAWKFTCLVCKSEKAARWREENVERCREYSRRNVDREKQIARRQERRATLYDRPFEEGIDRQTLRGLDGDACCYCGVVMTFEKFSPRNRPNNLATIEHVLAISRGGDHTWGNCALACWRCNNSKGARSGPNWCIREGHRLSG